MAGTDVIYSVGRVPQWIEVAKKLQSRCGWKPLYWIVYDDTEDAVRKAFPNAVLHHYSALTRGIPPVELRDISRDGLSQSILDRALQFEAVAMDLLDRVDLGRRYFYAERQRHYHVLLKYWLNVIWTYRPHRVVFNVPPHSIGEYILYAAARLENIPVRMVRPTPIGNLHFIADTIDELPKNLVHAYQKRLNGKNDCVGPAVESSLEEIRSAKPSYKPWYVDSVKQREEKRVRLRERGLRLAASNEAKYENLKVGEIVTSRITKYGLFSPEKRTNVFERTKKPTHDNRTRMFLKLPGVSVEKSYATKWDYITHRDWALVEKLRLERIYEELCEPFEPCRDYVYFAMHYQPERTTCPDGYRFNNQYLALSLIAHGLPDGWTLYVKEHPSQFNFHGMGELSRWADYYKDIAELPNVRFAKLGTPSIELIDGAKAVSTITGAVGWEALVRGKPTMYFGTAWYGACEGAYRVREQNDVRSALLEIRRTTSVSAIATRAYAGALEDIGRVCFTNPSLKPAVNISCSEQVEALFHLLVAFEDAAEAPMPQT